MNIKDPNLDRDVIALWVRLGYDPYLVGSIHLCLYDDYVMFSCGLLDELLVVMMKVIKVALGY